MNRMKRLKRWLMTTTALSPMPGVLIGITAGLLARMRGIR